MCWVKSECGGDGEIIGSRNFKKVEVLGYENNKSVLGST